MMELVDMGDLKSSGLGRAGSSPAIRTNNQEYTMLDFPIDELLENFICKSDGTILKKKLAGKDKGKFFKNKGYLLKKGNTSYLRIRYKNTEYLYHRIIRAWFDKKWPDIVHHINGDTMDNREKNLISVSKCYSRQKINEPNRGELGHVNIILFRKKYNLRIQKNRKMIHNKYYSDLQKAIKVRDHIRKIHELPKVT